MRLKNLHFSKMTVLVAGIDLIGTTRELAARIAEGGGRLIVTDINDEHFDALRADLASLDLTVEFIRTSPLKLAGIRPGSIDVVVCNYALSAINAIVGQGELALRKFFEVLKPGGKLYLEEELPFYMSASSAQIIWAEKTKLLKAAQLLAGMRSSNEYQPDVLEALVSQAGFEEIDVADEIDTIPMADWWLLFEERLNGYMNAIDNEMLKAGLIERKESLRAEVESLGSIDVPYFILTADKPWRIE